MRVTFGDFLLDSAERQLLRGDTPEHLTGKAFQLLVLLVAERPKVVSKKEIYDTLWPDVFVQEANIKNLIAELRAGDRQLEVEMEPPMLEDYPLETAPSERIVQTVSKASQEMGGRANLVGVPYGSDASKLARAGIPSVIFGPGSIDRAHAADEFVELDQVILATEIYARTILEF